MLGHVGFYVDNLTESDKFYSSLLRSLGYETVLSIPECIAYGMKGLPLFEIYTGKPKSVGIHIAFHVPLKKDVETFYSTALLLGAVDNGKPGYRDYAFPNYYAAYIIDLNGHNLEACVVGA